MYSIFELVNGSLVLLTLIDHPEGFLSKEVAYRYRCEHLPEEKKYIILPIY